MIGAAENQYRESTHNGVPCLEIVQSASTGVSGMGAANSNNVSRDLPLCNKLRYNDQLARQNSTAPGFDPVAWVKANPLLAGGAALALYFIFFKK